MAAGEDLLNYLLVPNFTLSVAHPARNEGQKENVQSRLHVDKSDEVGKSNMQVDAADQIPSHNISSQDAMASASAPDGSLGQGVSLKDFLDSHPLNFGLSTPISAPAPTPRAIGAHSSEHTQRLNQRYQAQAIPKPDFIITAGDEQGWRGKVVLVGVLGEGEDVEVSDEGLYASKQEAREKLSERVLIELDRLEAEGKMVKGGREKRKLADGVEIAPVEKKEKEPGINYIGQVLEFQQSTNAPLPTYHDYQYGTLFSCEATLGPSATPFGSRETMFPSKKAARQDAARCIVEHFQAQGVWPSTTTGTGSIRKKRTAPAVQNPSPPPSSSPGANGSDDGPPHGASYALRVAQLAVQLSLPTPTWSFTTCSLSAPGFHSVSCHFKDAAPHEGPIGEVRHIFGKKKAKEECARLTLEYLLGVKKRRTDYTNEMMKWTVRDKRAMNDVDEEADEFEDASEGMPA